ncbi:unnamed protein product [Rangifer tarandus platyrhynchus]|uniref:Uncharacterized protein n=1 Tax=Rangifer tarandus platyrhynchus TaxID=3082113 RepID=A0ABN8Z0D7_RANTA|nr:unnamed protein product [Rangifer tarandus platyrhynchus]
MGGLPLINPRMRSELEAGEDGAGAGNASLGIWSRHLGAPLRFGWAPASPELPQPWAKAPVPPSCCQPTGAGTFYSPASTSPARNHNHDKDPPCVRPSSQVITVILKADVETEFISITHRGSGQLPGFEEANVQAGAGGAATSVATRLSPLTTWPRLGTDHGALAHCPCWLRALRSHMGRRKRGPGNRSPGSDGRSQVMEPRLPNPPGVSWSLVQPDSLSLSPTSIQRLRVLIAGWRWGPGFSLSHSTWGPGPRMEELRRKEVTPLLTSLPQAPPALADGDGRAPARAGVGGGRSSG